MRRNRTSRDSNFRSPAMESVIDTHSVAAVISAAIRRAWGEMSAPVKRYCRVVGVDPRTGRNHWEAKNCPRAPELIRLMAECDEAFEAVLAMSNRLTPETVERLLEIVTAPGGSDHESNPD